MTSRGAATASRLLAAAREVFADRGFAAARVEDIVATAGVSHGTFYTYFDNRAAVLDALVDECVAGLRAVVAAPWDGHDVAGAVADVIGRFVQVYARHGDVIRAWVDAGAYDEHFRDRLRDVRRDYVRRVAGHLEPVTHDTGHDPLVAASALVAMVEGYATQGEGVGREAEADEVRTLAAIWAGGLRALAGDGPAS